MSVARWESFIKNNKIDFKYYDGKKIESSSFHFMNIDEHIEAYRLLNNFNLKKRDSKERYIAVFVNPISGQRKAFECYNLILKPMLDFTGIKHDMFVTDSSHFISDFIQNLDLDQMVYTNFVVISGDGIFN